MKTGTDISISVCRSEGYPVVEHARGKGMNPKQEYMLTISDPRSWSDSGYRLQGKDEYYLYYDKISYVELHEQFEKQGKGIKDYCDHASCPILTPTDDGLCFDDFVNLAGILMDYCGIE